MNPAGTMPSSSGITGFLKKLFRRPISPAQELAEAANKARIASGPSASGRMKAPTQVAMPSSTTETKIPAPAPSSHATIEVVRLLLKQIINRFPADLQNAIRKMPSDHIWIEVPKAKIEGQLARGAVKIPFVELRRMSPEGFFSANTTFDQHLVSLPLGEILRQLKPARRADQKQAASPAHIAPIFNRAQQHNSQKSEAWYSTPTKPTPHVDDYEKASPVARVVAHSNTVVVPVLPPLSQVVPSAFATSTVPDHVDVPVSLIANSLPDQARRDLGAENISHAVLSLPMGMLEPMVKKGKVLFEWKHLHSWLKTTAPVSMTCDAIIDLPLQVIVPIFLAAQKKSSAQRRVAVDMTIPDVFAKTTSVSASLPSEPAQSSARHTNSVSSAAGSLPVPNKGSMRPHWLPDEIVSHACEMESIAGAFIATHDGLLVAGQTPGLNERTVSAFAPTLFAQVKAYSQVTGLGEAQSVVVHLGDRAVQIFRCDKLYFGALSRPGQSLPAAKLAKIADQLRPEE
jgi:predicted regulator of Ras-like GTPase activity (Roadblock/LC7/MglB family)